MAPSSLEQWLQSQPPHLGKSVTGLYKAFGRCQEVAFDPIWIKFAPWRVCLPCSNSKQITQQTTMEQKISRRLWINHSITAVFQEECTSCPEQKPQFDKTSEPSWGESIFHSYCHQIRQCKCDQPALILSPNVASLAQPHSGTGCRHCSTVTHTNEKIFYTQTLGSTKIKVQCFYWLHLFLVHACHLGNILFISSFIFNLNDAALPAC